MGRASMRKWVRRSRAASPWAPTAEPTAHDRKYALHMRLRERKRQKFWRRFELWTSADAPADFRRESRS